MALATKKDENFWAASSPERCSSVVLCFVQNEGPIERAAMKYQKYRLAHNILKLNVNTLQCYISENVYRKGKIFQNNIIFRKCL